MIRIKSNGVVVGLIDKNQSPINIYSTPIPLSAQARGLGITEDDKDHLYDYLDDVWNGKVGDFYQPNLTDWQLFKMFWGFKP